MTLNPDDYVPGEDITHMVKRSNRPGIVLSVRLDMADAMALGRVAERAGTQVIDLARVAIQEYLANHPCDPASEPSLSAPLAAHSEHQSQQREVHDQA